MNPYDNVMSNPVSPPDLSGLSISSQLERNTNESYDSHPNTPAFFSTAPPGGAPYGNNVGHGQQLQAHATYDAAPFNNTIASAGSKARGGLPSVCNFNRLCSAIPTHNPISLLCVFGSIGSISHRLDRLCKMAAPCPPQLMSHLPAVLPQVASWVLHHSPCPAARLAARHNPAATTTLFLPRS
jgi:hypothetical protein